MRLPAKQILQYFPKEFCREIHTRCFVPFKSALCKEFGEANGGGQRLFNLEEWRIYQRDYFLALEVRFKSHP